MIRDFTGDVGRVKRKSTLLRFRAEGPEKVWDSPHTFTLCSSYYTPESKALLELNRGLVEKMNPGVELPWVVADNTSPEYSGDKIRDPRFVVVPGARELEPEHIIRYHKGKTPSCEHGVVLNNFHKHVKTRFALILDNDFFIIQPNWIERVLAHMDEKGLAFFGSPFHPRYYHKLRYFPCPQLFFVDTEKVPMASLNFMPKCDFRKEVRTTASNKSVTARHSILSPKSLVWKMGRAIFGAPDKFNYHYNPFSIRERGMIEGSKDTVTYILGEYRDHESVHSECLQPTYKPSVDGGPGGARYMLSRFLELFLPDSLCFVPKRSGYFSERSFKDRGYYDVQGRDKWWEELLWQDKPFGFHLRYHRTITHHGLETDLSLIREIITSFHCMNM